MKIRLNMVEPKSNDKNMYKEELKCSGCREEEETTEHLFKCEKYKELARHNLKIEEKENHFKQIEWLFEAIKVVDRIEKVKEKIDSKMSKDVK